MAAGCSSMGRATGGPHFKFNEAISFQVRCEEIDYYWGKLTAEGEKGPCGWLKDKYGVSWQIVPAVLPEMLMGPDSEKTQRVTKAFLQMKKFDVEELKSACAARHATTYIMPGEHDQGRGRICFNGPVRASWRHGTSSAAWSWSPCWSAKRSGLGLELNPDWGMVAGAGFAAHPSVDVARNESRRAGRAEQKKI
jgi:hypothetical protein